MTYSTYENIGTVMISQPMGGKSYSEIVQTREEAMVRLSKMGATVIDTLFTDEWRKNEESTDDSKSPLWFLAKSLDAMSQCNAVYFCKGWEKARGCRIEHEAAKEYGLAIYYEK